MTATQNYNITKHRIFIILATCFLISKLAQRVYIPYIPVNHRRFPYIYNANRCSISHNQNQKLYIYLKKTHRRQKKARAGNIYIGALFPVSGNPQRRVYTRVQKRLTYARATFLTSVNACSINRSLIYYTAAIVRLVLCARTRDADFWFLRFSIVLGSHGFFFFWKKCYLL